MGSLDLWAVLAPILIADVLNPVLLAAVVYALGTARPYASALAILAGHTALYLGAGLALGVGLEAMIERLNNPEPVDFAIELVLGVALLVVGIGLGRGGGPPTDFSSKGELGPGAAFLMGGVINLVGLPFAVPYFGAIAQILKADLSPEGGVAALVLYNLLYPAPFAAVIAMRRALGERAKEPLQRLTQVIDRIGGWLGPLMILLLGIAFLADAASFFLRGKSLFPPVL